MASPIIPTGGFQPDKIAKIDKDKESDKTKNELDVEKTNKAIEDSHLKPSATGQLQTVPRAAIPPADQSLFKSVDELRKIATDKTSSKNFTKNFISQMFENPKKALEYITNNQKELAQFPFNYAQLKHSLRFYGSIGITQNNDNDFAACLALMKEPFGLLLKANFQCEEDLYKFVLEMLIQCDLPKSFGVLISQMHFKRDAIPFIMKFDSVECLKELVASGLECNLVARTLDDCAVKCLSYMVSQYGLSEKYKEQYIKLMADRGNIEMLQVLLQNNSEKAAQLIFEPLIPLLRNPAPYQKKIEEELTKIVSKLLRMNPIESVDRIVANFIAQNEVAADLFPEIYQKAKTQFLRVAPFISRNIKKDDLDSIRRVYSNKTEEEHQLTEEIEYATFCRSQVEEFVEKLQDNTLNEPSSKEFAQLPPSKTGTRRVAALVERIGEIRSARQLARAGKGREIFNKDEYLSFKTLRKIDYEIPIAGKYIWAAPLVNSVELLSISSDIAHKTQMKKTFFEVITETLRTYELRYNNIVVNKVSVEKQETSYLTPKQICHHGQAKVEDTWQATEDTFEKLMAFDLKKPEGNNPVAQRNYEKRLDEFYAATAELVWLIGNTTPLERGSGTVAEWLLGIVHLHHGLEPPVLKTQFPQLDVLDITFPLSDYKDFFTYFFEASTLPPHIRWPDLSSKSIFAQMDELYAAKREGRFQQMHKH